MGRPILLVLVLQISAPVFRVIVIELRKTNRTIRHLRYNTQYV